jgi:hypothetical protein
MVNIMDAKEERLIKQYYDKLTSFSFDERDVYSLLILLRPHSQKDSPVYEFANFVAHREKDRGHIRDYLNRTKDVLDNLGKINTVLEIKPVFTKQEIKKSFNSVFVKLGFAPVSDEVISGIMLCTISLLQSVKIVTKKNATIGELVFAYDAHEITLLGKCRIQSKVDAVFPVLSTENRYIPTSVVGTPILSANIIEVVNNNGKLEIVGV